MFHQLSDFVSTPKQSGEVFNISDTTLVSKVVAIDQSLKALEEKAKLVFTKTDLTQLRSEMNIAAAGLDSKIGIVNERTRTLEGNLNLFRTSIEGRVTKIELDSIIVVGEVYYL